MERHGLLYDASIEGNVTALLMLLQEDPLILDRVTLNHCDDLPLYVAAMLGHTDFVNEILIRKPQLATECDSRRRLPLHIASAKGHVEVVRALVLANPETCLARDRDGKNPLHVAAIKGRYDVMKELVQAQRHAARAMVQQETILHLCVKHNQLEVLKFLIETMGDHEFVNSKDGHGNTILHLAVADKQIETIRFLLLDTTIEMNALNSKGETSMVILAQGPRDVEDQEIIKLLKQAGAVDTKEEIISLFKQSPQNNSKTKMALDDNKTPSPSHFKKRKLKPSDDDDRLEKKRNAFMVVASLIATMAFQAGINPPGGTWQQDSSVSSNSTTPTPQPAFQPGASLASGFLPDVFTTASDVLEDQSSYKAGEAVMATKQRVRYQIFLVLNTVGFISTMCIILLLISGLPFLKHAVLLFILKVILWIATASMSLTYSVVIITLTPATVTGDKIFEYVLCGIIIAWVALLTLIFVGYILRLFNLLINVIRKLIKF